MLMTSILTTYDLSIVQLEPDNSDTEPDSPLTTHFPASFRLRYSRMGPVHPHFRPPLLLPSSPNEMDTSEVGIEEAVYVHNVYKNIII